MEISEVKRKFYSENPSTPAYFVFNEKLNKFVCFALDYTNSKTANVFFSEKDIAKIKNISSDNKLNDVIEYAYQNATNDTIELLSDFYYDYISNNFPTDDLEVVLKSLNNYASNHSKAKANTTTKHFVTGHILEENGELSSYVFKMEVSIMQNKKGQKYCHIDNTSTESAYRKNGLHYMGLKFLESYLASKNIYTLVGESDETEAFESNSNDNLDRHYEKMGFSVKPKENGKSEIVKSIDPDLCIDLYGEEISR